jgi:transcriptional regulator with XRE-family HTH domain
MEMFSKENTFSRAAIGRRVRQVRGGLTCQAFGARLGVSAGFVSEIEHGRKKPSAEMLFALESQFGVDANWLLRGGERQAQVAEAPPTYGAARGRRPPASSAIPLYTLDGGAGAFALPPTDVLRLPTAFSGPTIIATLAPDETMTPTLPPGTIVGIDRSQTAISDGGIYVVSLKEQSSERFVIRRLYKVRGGLRLRADNERHADLTALRKQARVVGRVVWSLQRMD